MRAGWFVVLVAVGCTDSPEDRLDKFEAEANIECWSYYCPGREPGLPTSSIDERLSCMNDALTSGARAKASWTVERIDGYTYDGMRVFTVDHQVKVFTVHGFADDPPEYVERRACNGPFKVGPDICGYGSQAVSVQALAWDGCP
jgi:hypothetical protein